MARYDKKTDENRKSHTLLPGKPEPTNERELNRVCLYYAERGRGRRSQNRGMRTEQIAEIINSQRLHIRKDGEPVTSNQVYAVICSFPRYVCQGFCKRVKRKVYFSVLQRV